MTIKTLYHLVQEGEGFSVTSELFTYVSEDGYAVGGSVLHGVFSLLNDDLSFRVFSKEINRLQALCTDPTQAIGAWLDAGCPHGMVYLEISDVVKSKQVALELAQARGEKAIYDFANSESIYL